MGDPEQYGFTKQIGGSGVIEFTPEYMLMNSNGWGPAGYTFPVSTMESGAFEIEVLTSADGIPIIRGFMVGIFNATATGARVVLRYPQSDGNCWLAYEPSTNENKIANYPLDGQYHTIKAVLDPVYANYWIDNQHVGVNLQHAQRTDVLDITKSQIIMYGANNEVKIRSLKVRVGE